MTPYRGREQSASGALTFALAAGCAVVSTPYWYAQDMLTSGAGRLVPFDDAAALADAVCDYVAEPAALTAARAEARRIGASLSWPSVAQATAAVLAEAHERAPRRRPLGVDDLQLTSLRTDHLLTLVDDVGIVQHAHGIIPNRVSGYCVDDVARLAVVSLALARRGDEQPWTSILYRSLAFLHAAEGEGGMRNFMSYDRRWLDEPHIGDHVGRAVWALGEILATAWIPAVVVPARDLLERLVAKLSGEVALRTAAYTVLGSGTRRSRPAQAAGAAAAHAARRAARGRLSRARLRRLVLVRGRAHVRQRAAVTGSRHGRQRAGARRPDRPGTRVSALARRRVRPPGRRAPPAGPSWPAPRRGRSGRRRRAAARRRRTRRSGAGGVRRHPPDRARRPRATLRSNGSSDATGSTGRSTTSPREGAATDSARRPST